MGIFYDGPYAEDVNHDAFHEGYAGRLWPDGTITSGWGGETGRTGHSGLVGACGCGWRSDQVRPPGEDDSPEYEAALSDFQTQHLDPLIDEATRRSWPRWTRQLAARANQITSLVTQRRFDDATDLLAVLAPEVTHRIALVAQLAAEQEYAAARDLGSARLVDPPRPDVPPAPTWTPPAPPPPGRGPGR